MNWDLCERTEDAIVAYLKTTVSGDIRVSAAWERDALQCPAALVLAESSVPISEQAEWHDGRMIRVRVSVITEAADSIDGNATVSSKRREINAATRSSVMDALFTSGLLASLQGLGTPSVAFSMAQFVTEERSAEGKTMVTVLTGDVIAEPVTGG